MAERPSVQSSRMSVLYAEFSAWKKAKRVGRGPGSGLGKTAGRGQKGSGARSGFSRSKRRAGLKLIMQQKPKFGFTSQKSLVTAKLPLSALRALDPKAAKEGVTLALLQQTGLVAKNTKYVRIYLSGDIDFPVTFTDEIKISKGVLSATTKATKKTAQVKKEG